MKRPIWKLITAGLFGIGAIVVAMAGDLSPATASNVCYRTASGSPLIGSFVRGSTLRLTNWLACANATGTATQNLTGIRTEITVGTESFSQVYTATVQNAAAGLFACDITVPTNTTAQQNIEVMLVDTGVTPNVSYVYPWYTFGTRATLRE